MDDTVQQDQNGKTRPAASETEPDQSITGRPEDAVGNAAVLITGAGRRIGRHLARHCAGRGMIVHLHCNKSRSETEQLAEEISQAGGVAFCHQADLADADAVGGLMAAAMQAAPLTALINNASLFALDTAATVSASMLQQHMAINAMAPALLIQHFAAARETMAASASSRHDRPSAASAGAVINITDAKLAGLNPDYYSYTLSKIALDGLTRLAAQAYAPGLRVNAIAPGIVLRSGEQTEEEYRQAHRRNPLGCGARLEDLAAATDLLLDTPSISGHTIIIDGGLHLSPHGRDVAFLAGSGG